MVADNLSRYPGVLEDDLEECDSNTYKINAVKFKLTKECEQIHKTVEKFKDKDPNISKLRDELTSKEENQFTNFYKIRENELY